MADAAPFLHLLSTLRQPGEKVRIVRTDNDGGIVTFEFDPDAATTSGLLEAAEQYGWNLWFEVQPSAFNRPAGRSRAGDVTRLAALYADIDYKAKPHGMGSLPESQDLLHDLEGALGAPPSVIVHSGHGIQPYWPISDGEINEFNRDRVAGLLKRWGMLVKQFALTHHGDVDGVYDLPRVLRVPGSTNFKNPASPIATVTEIAPTVSFTLDEIEQILDDYGITSVDVAVATGIVSPISGWDWAEHDCEFTDIARLEIAESNPRARHPWMLKYASTLNGMIRSGCLTEPTFYELRDALVQRFQLLCATQEPIRVPSNYEINSNLNWGRSTAEGWSPEKLGDEMRQHVHRDFVLGVTAESYQQRTVSRETPLLERVGFAEAEPQLATVSSIYTGAPVVAGQPMTDGALALDVELKIQQRLGLAAFTDTGNGERLATQLRGRYIYVPQLGWHSWDGRRYVLDSGGTVMEGAKDLFMHMLSTATVPEAIKWAHQSLNQARLNAAIKSAMTVPYLVVDTLDLDSNAYELCTPGGIVNLRTASIREANPLTDMNTMMTAYTPDFDAAAPRFEAFMRFAIGDDERILYLQRLFGVASIGEVLFHLLPIFVGIGGNGKTTLLDLVAGAFGQYAATLPKNFLVEKRQEPHPTEIAQLRGVRLATASEVPPGARFDETLVKTITGETRLRGRYMNKDFFDFKNTVTMFQAANHLPGIQAGGNSMFRRIRKIDFTNVMPDAQANVRLVQEILQAEGEALMAWVVRGARDVLMVGLNDPQSVLTSTREYQLEEDTLASFLYEYTTEIDGMEVGREFVFAAYQAWSFRLRQPVLPFAKFCREVVAMRPKTNLGARALFTNMVLNTVTPDRED